MLLQFEIFARLSCRVETVVNDDDMLYKNILFASRCSTVDCSQHEVAIAIAQKVEREKKALADPRGRTLLQDSTVRYAWDETEAVAIL